MISRKVLLPVVLFTLTLPVLSAGEEVDTIIGKYLEAIGGKDQLSSLNSRVVKGTLKLVDRGMYAPITISVVPPDKMLTVVEVSGYGTALNGVNGEIAWDINPIVGPRVLSGSAKKAGLLRAQFNPFLNWKENFEGAELAGEEEIAGKTCSKVIFSQGDAEPLTAYFDQETGLLVRMVSKLDGQTIETTQRQYEKTTDGLMVARAVEVDTPQLSYDIEVESIEHNVEIPEKTFDFPPEIQRILDRTE